MSIETTINLQTAAFEKLFYASEKTARTPSQLIVHLMERVMADGEELVQTFCRIGYQKRDPERKWARPHVRLSEGAYEYALDLRKFFKMSFSAIVAMAIEKFLDKLVQDLLYPEKANEDDNYPAKNYILVSECVDDLISWRIYWGIPRDLSIVLPRGTE